MNPINRADPFEVNMIEWFTENPSAKEWHGLIKTDQRSYYTRLKAIYAEAECLRCHGDPAVAPAALTDRYGTKGGFHYQVGDVVAADKIYIPVDIPLVAVKEAALNIFFIALVVLLALLGLFHLLFNRTVVSELKGLPTTFRGISQNESSNQPAISFEPGDEVTQLKRAFEQVARDLTRTHEELRTSEAKYRLIFESSQDVILILGESTRICDINAAGMALFGLKSRDEALSIETAYQLFWDVRDARRLFGKIEALGSITGVETPMVDRQGKKLYVLISATVRLDETNQLLGIDMMIRDVTARRRLEKHLIQSEKLAAIGQLASGVAHEINNPLGVIKCYADLIAKGVSDNRSTMEDLQVIRKHTDQCKSVVEGLLSFARISEPKMVSTDLHQCLEDVLKVITPQLHEDGIVLKKELISMPVMITADPQKIKQVFMNLILNARQAIGQEGTITVCSRLQDKGNAFAIEIADTGKGIGDKNIDRIFEPFFSTKGAQEGTGLGLSVSYGIIKQHGGEIEVESEPGNGSHFTIILPTDADRVVETDQKDVH